jgi:hypothetical protein
MPTKVHKVFISFHHGDKKKDPQCGEYWKERFEHLFHDTFEVIISKSIHDGDIEDGENTDTTRRIIRDDYIAEATVTVVLIGPETWKRKHVDWEISSSIRKTDKNPRCGLIGILLPTYKGYNEVKKTYYQYTIPPRLQKNVDCGFAKIYLWDENPEIVQDWIHKAFERKDKIDPDNSYRLFADNRGANQTQWQDE